MSATRSMLGQPSSRKSETIPTEIGARPRVCESGGLSRALEAALEEVLVNTGRYHASVILGAGDGGAGKQDRIQFLEVTFQRKLSAEVPGSAAQRVVMMTVREGPDNSLRETFHRGRI